MKLLFKHDILAPQKIEKTPTIRKFQMFDTNVLHRGIDTVETLRHEDNTCFPHLIYIFLWKAKIFITRICENENAGEVETNVTGINIHLMIHRYHRLHSLC